MAISSFVFTAVSFLVRFLVGIYILLLVCIECEKFCRLAPSSVTTVLFEERTKDYAVPRCIGLGDISHLYASGLRIPNSSYEKANSFYPFPRPSGIKSNFF